MRDIILLISCILVTGFIGWNILYILSGRKGFNEISSIEKISLSYLFGLGVITFQMFIMSLFAIKFTRFNILIPWVLVALVNWRGFMRVQTSQEGCLVSGGAPSPLRGSGIALFSLIGLQVFYNFFRALIRPIEAYDAVAIYGLKSKIMYLAGGIAPHFFQNIASDFSGAHPDYPLLIPLSETWIYTFLGDFNDILVKAIFPLFYLSFIFIFYTVLKRITKSRTLSFLFTFLLASIKQFSDYSTIGVADLQLGVFFAIGLFYLYLWIRDKQKKYFLNISLVSSVLCIWTKNEGILLALITLFILFFYISTNIKKVGRDEILRFFVYILVVLIVTMSWNMFKHHHGLVNENFNLSMVNIANLISGINKIPAILYEYQKQLFGFKKWNIIWILFVFVFLKGFKTAFSDNIKYVTLVFFLFGLGYMLMYIFSVVEIDFFVRKTGSRFLLHILPVTVFWMAIMAHRQKLIKDL